MAINVNNAINQIAAGLAGNVEPFLWDKAVIGTSVAATYSSYWRISGVPAIGAIPAAAALCTKALVGAIAFTNQTSPITSYLAQHDLSANASNYSFEIFDRLCHMGGLNGTLTTAQTVGINLATLAVPAARLGDAAYSGVMWFLEWYTATGATAVNATVAVIYSDATTGNIVIALPVSVVAAGCKQILPAHASGLFIKEVTSVTLSATTGTAGSFGVTAATKKISMAAPTANRNENFDWAQLGLPEIPNDSCLYGMVYCSSSSVPFMRGQGRIIHA